MQATSENAARGTLEDQGDGLFQYTFANPLPANFDRDASHRIAIYADTTILDVEYVSNAIHDFVPSGKPVTAVRDIVRTEQCNGCHDPLEAHGGTRRDVRLCVTCHSSHITDFATGETTEQIDPDTGHNIGFPELIHKIHRGESLPSVEAGTPYQIIGFRQTVVDFSDVAFPQDIRNCETCHAGGTQSHAFATNPSRQACGSCHDDVNFASGENHGGGPQPTDGSCSSCHLPETGKEFDLSVVGSHTIPAHSSQAPGVRFELIGVQSVETGDAIVAPGEHPLVTFRITDGSGTPLAPSSLRSLSLTLGGPTTEYSAQDYDGDGEILPGDPSSPWTPGAETFKSESAIKDAQGPDGSGVSTYIFKSTVPPNATGTLRGRHRGLQVRRDRGREAEPRRHQLLGVARRERQRSRGPRRGLQRDPRRRSQPGAGVSGHRHGAGDAPAAGRDRELLGLPRRVLEGLLRARQPPQRHAVLSRVPQPVERHADPSTAASRRDRGHHPDRLQGDDPQASTAARTSRSRTSCTGSRTGTFPEPDVDGHQLPGAALPRRPPRLRGVPPARDLRAVPGRGRAVARRARLDAPVSSCAGRRRSTVLDVFTTPPTIAVCTSCHDDVDFTTGANHPAGPQPEESCANCHGVGKSLSVERTHFPGLPPEDRIQRPN